MNRYNSDAHWEAVNNDQRHDRAVLEDIDGDISEDWPQLAELFTTLRKGDPAEVAKLIQAVQDEHEKRLEIRIVATYDKERRNWGDRAA